MPPADADAGAGAAQRSRAVERGCAKCSRATHSKASAATYARPADKHATASAAGPALACAEAGIQKATSYAWSDGEEAGRTRRSAEAAEAASDDTWAVGNGRRV